MRNILQASDRDRLVGLLTGPLARQVSVAGQRLVAIAEGDGEHGSGLCFTAGNANAAELLWQPAVQRGAAAFADGVLGFILAMEQAATPARAAAAGGIEVLRDDPRDFEVLTPFHRYNGDLRAGLLRQHLLGPAAFAGGALRHPAIHSGNMAEFRIGRHRACLDIEDAITEAALVREGDALVLTHGSTLRAKAGWLVPRLVEVGHVTYRHVITPASPVLRTEVTFTARHAVAALRLTTALDALGAPGLEIAAGRVNDGAWRDAAPIVEPGLTGWSAGAPLHQLSLGAAGWPAGEPTLHLRPADPARVLSAKVEARRAGLAHWLVLRHGPFDLAAGEAVTIGQATLLAAGLAAEDAARGMAAASDGLDLAAGGPEPAVMSAVATALLHDARDAYAPGLPRARRAAMLEWLETRLSAVAEGPASIAMLAHALMAADMLARMGPRAAGPTAVLALRLVESQDAAGAFHAGAPAVIPHALALLALARAAGVLPGIDLAPALARGVAALQPGEVPLGSHGGTLDSFVVAGGAPHAVDDHAEVVAMVVRAAGAVALAGTLNAPSLPAATVAAAVELHRLGVGLLRPLVRLRGPLLEVASSPRGGAVSAAAQAAATLALLCPEAETMRLPVLAVA